MGTVIRLARDGVDFCDREGALRLRDMIVMYWRRQGYMGIAVVIADEKRMIAGAMVDVYSTVRSNIGPRGFPPRI